ncbi:NADH:ubiquinone oxidoreductase subunit M [Planctomycetota bacterium]|nr:NADH:ubiquinone oxidoreductase subunit M [Planctomycetota bacterium]
MQYALLVLLVAPALASLIAAVSSPQQSAADHRLGFFLSLLVAALGLPLLWNAYPALSLPWFPLIGTGATVHLSLASDGLSAWLAQLVLWLTPAAILGARATVGERMGAFVTAVLAMEALMLGALFSRDLVVFYMCFEGMLIPMAVLIWLFGGHDRLSAALWFVLYTMAGSIPLLLAIWWLAAQAGTVELAALPAFIAKLPADQQGWLFLAFVLAFAVKVPLIPLHGWQARTYAETPGPAVALLAGAMAKLGIYGFLRFVLPLFPVLSAEHANTFIVLGLIGTVGGALVAIAQDDAKRMLAYSSLSHLSLVMVGVFTFQTDAMHGTAVQMVAHGLSVGALFLLVGWVEAKSGTYGVDDFGGLSSRAPLLAVLFVIAALASAALPGTANFVGEFALLLGMWKSDPWIAAIAGLSVILGVVYLLTLIQRWFYGRVHASSEPVTEISPAVALAVLPLLFGAFAFGLFPGVITRTAGATCDALARPAREAAAARKPAAPIPQAPAAPAPAAESH